MVAVMTTDTSPEAVAKMLEGVTPGPWFVTEDRNTWGWVNVDGPSLNVSGPTMATNLTSVDKTTRLAEARFIAWAREAVPALAARVAELEEANGKADPTNLWRFWNDKALGLLNKLTAAEAQLASVEGENARLRGAGDAMARDASRFHSALWWDSRIALTPKLSEGEST